jgi:hypothetical protein
MEILLKRYESGDPVSVVGVSKGSLCDTSSILTKSHVIYKKIP